MRILGIVLVVVGILMFVFKGINFKTEKTVLDVGPLKVDKKENNRVAWPEYAGGILIIAGIVCIIIPAKKS